MTTYITQDGARLTANSATELLNQLQPVISNSILTEIPTNDADHAIATLIQRDYLRVVDVIDG